MSDVEFAPYREDTPEELEESSEYFEDDCEDDEYEPKDGYEDDAMSIIAHKLK